MTGLIFDAVCYVLYVETPLTVRNTSIISSIFYNKYAGVHISTVVLSVVSSVWTYLIRGSSFLTVFSKTLCDSVYLYLLQLSFVKNFCMSLGAVELLRVHTVL